MLPFFVEFTVGDPAGPQLEAALQRAILSGQLPPASRVPGWRAVSAELRIHPDAVREVFATLRRAGWLIGDDEQPVAALPGADAVEATRVKLIRKKARSLRADARRLGVSMERVHDILNEEGADE